MDHEIYIWLNALTEKVEAIENILKGEGLIKAPKEKKEESKEVEEENESEYKPEIVDQSHFKEKEEPKKKRGRPKF